MSRFPIACQTITFGTEQSQNYPEVFRVIREAGYAGVEIGYQRFSHIAPDEFRELLSDNALAMAAMHASGNLEAPGREHQTVLEDIIAYAGVVGTSRIVYSGLRWDESSQFHRDLECIGRSAVLCSQNGIKLCYHNHEWEFGSGGRVIDALVTDAPEELHFCPDIGWVHVAGVEVMAFLENISDRLAAIHFKDVSGTMEDLDTVVLGHGAVPLREVAMWLRENTTGMWIVAEQDTADIPAEEAVRKNASFLRKLF
jgi:sugar phosphate isomerase/epimerase